MPTLVLSQAEVRQLLPMDVCMDLMAEALATLGRGQAINPLRRGIRLPEEQRVLGMMPGYLGSPEALGLKVVTVFPGNHGTEYDAHQGVVILFETTHGTPQAIMDASEITAIRTAAVSGVATRLLAREDATDLAILGSGVQARTHLQAMRVARDIGVVRVYSPSTENRERFADTESRRHGIPVKPVPTAEEAVRGADIVCTTTSSAEPVLRAEWLAEGAHINAAGSSVPHARELDTATVVKSRFFVDRRESAVNEAGDLLFPIEEKAVTEDHIVGEIGDIVLGRIGGRESETELTVFKSLGLAVEDLASAYHVNEEAIRTKTGTVVDLGGRRHADP